MSVRTIGIVMNGVTGRMGYRQHLVRSILAIREQGGVALADGSRVKLEPVLVGRNADKLAAHRRPARPRRLHHRPRRGAGRRRQPDLLRRPGHPAPRAKAIRKAIEAGKHIYTEKPHRRDARRARSSWPGSPRRAGRQARRRAGQAVPARPAQAQAAGRRRLLRPDPVGARRVRLLGLRGRLAAAQRPSLELPRRGRRRHRRSTCSRTGTTCWRTCSAGSQSVYAHGRDAHPAARGRARAALRGHRRRRRVRHLRAGRRRHRADQLLLGGPGEPRRAGGVPGRRHARQRRRGPAQLPRPAPRRHPEAGVEPRPAGHRATSATSGRRCPDNDEFDNGFKVAVGGVPAARRRGRAVPVGLRSPAPAACSSPSWACGPRREGRRHRGAGAACDRSTLPGGDGTAARAA